LNAQTNQIQTLLIAVVAALVIGFAFGAYAQGDGSRTNNPDLLRGSYGPFCERPMLCHPEIQARALEQPLRTHAAPAPVAAPEPAGTDMAVPVAYEPIQPAPEYQPPPVSHSPWQFRYGASLRGRFVISEDNERFDLIATPRASWIYEGSRTQVGINSEVSVVAPGDNDARIEEARVSFDVAHRLDSFTGLSAEGALAIRQNDPRGLDFAPSGAMTAPLEFAGEVNTRASHQFGRAVATFSTGLARSYKDETLLNDGSVIDNSADSSTRVSAGLRLSQEISPIISIFGQADVAREAFDTAAPGLGVKQDSWLPRLRGGISGNWNDVVTTEASLGYGWRVFDVDTLETAHSILYGAALGWRPNGTTQLRLAFDSAIGAGGGGNAARLDYDLTLEGSYTVNSWLALRASTAAGWQYDMDGNWGETRLTAGIGSDIMLGRHSSLNFDYAYGVRERANADPATREEHRISGGVTLQY